MARTNVLFVTIDRPEDVDLAWHDPNVAGLRAAASLADPALVVTRATIDDLLGLDAAAFDAKYAPLAIFGAGSWSEWFHYGDDDAWRTKLDGYMAILRDTTVPMLAVCGSHQLVAAAYNGWSAVAHMNDAGDPIPIASELASDPPALLAPLPRLGEEGTYPVAIVADDPIVVGASPMFAVHHKDMVIATDGFTLLATSDPSRPAATTAGDQVATRCRVHATRLDDPGRLLYTTQFHPEMSRFDESTIDDGGAGRALLISFLRAAAAWWGSSA